MTSDSETIVKQSVPVNKSNLASMPRVRERGRDGGRGGGGEKGGRERERERLLMMVMLLLLLLMMMMMMTTTRRVLSLPLFPS
jgi:hypothetical protein